MTEPSKDRKDLLEEILNRKNLGEKKYHSETSLQKFGEENEEQTPELTQDPGVLNTSVSTLSAEDAQARRRAVSQPGPVSGSLYTATAGRKRRRPPRNVMYAADLERADSTERMPKFILSNKDDYSYPPTPLPYENTPSPLSYNGNGNILYQNFRNGDIKSLNGYRLNTPTEMRGGTTPRKRSVVTMDAQSLRSVETQAPPPTSPEENARLTIKYLTLMLSCMYAVLLVTLGFIIYLTDPFLRDISTSPIYSLILLGLGFMYHIYLVIDITRYKRIAVKNQKIKSLYDRNLQEFFKKQEEEYGYSPGERTPDSTASQVFPSPSLLPMKHDYCFSHGRHSGSFYLKLGAAGFALGHLIHSVLQITVQVGYLTDDNINNDECIDYPQFSLDIASPLYCFIQLYFIFKYSNVHILKAQGLAHFGFMHMIGSSLCFWVFNIVRETVLSLTIYAGILYGNRTGGKEEIPVEPTHFDSVPTLDISILYNENCTGSEAITSIIENLSPYLYPFGVEYNILIVAVYYIIWSHIGICEGDDGESSSDSDDNQTICKIPSASEENDYTSNIVIHADCHASNKGLFLGLILSVAIVGLLILGIVFSSVGDEYLELGYFLNSCTKLGLHTIMLFAVVIAYNQTRKLDINEHPVSLLDDILLFICLPAFFMETAFSLVATVNILNIVKSIDVVVMAIQVIIQTTLLVDGLRRCSNSRKLRRSKPGREVLMFLLIGNVAMWLLYTFSYKAPDSLDERYEFYGKILWGILGHVCLPLIMFYRFHSSVCFSDIWGAAYKPGSDH